MPDTARAAVCTAQQRLAVQEHYYLLEQLHTPHSDVAAAERAMQTLAGAFSEEQALYSAIVPQQIIRWAYVEQRWKLCTSAI
jgi:hypothetical protein